MVVLQGSELANTFALFAGNLGVFQCEECSVQYGPLSSSFLGLTDWL